MRVNFLFLFLIAIPLGAYLVVILFQTREIGAGVPLTEHATANVDLAKESVTDLLALRQATEIVATESVHTVEKISDALVAPSEFVAAIESAPARATEQENEAAQLQETNVEAKGALETIVETVTSSQDAFASLPETEMLNDDESELILPEGPVQLPEKGSPKYAFDYRGRLWVEKKRKGFFRQLRRPLMPPDEPQNNSSR